MSLSSATATGSSPAQPVLFARQRLEGLQALRGLAALLVVTLHATQLTGAFGRHPELLRLATNGIAAVGYFGVDIFFVLSGVVVSILLERNATRPEAPGGFLVRRAAKLLPTFWVTLALLLLLPPSPDANTDPMAIVSRPLSLLLLASQDAQPVGWTLIYEAHFYLVAALALGLGARASAVMLAWVPLQVAAVGLSTIGWLPDYVALKPLSLELCAGLLIGMAAARWRMPAPGLVAVGAIAVMAAAALVLPLAAISEAGAPRLLVLGLPAALLVYAVISLEAAGWKPPALAVRLGEISYSLYMWHIPVLVLLAVAMIGVLPGWGGAVAYWGLGVSGSIVVAVVAYRTIEAPVVGWANRLTRGKLLEVQAAS